jgi:hypothetical protein
VAGILLRIVCIYNCLFRYTSVYLKMSTRVHITALRLGLFALDVCVVVFRSSDGYKLQMVLSSPAHEEK